MRKPTENKILYALKCQGEMTADMLGKSLAITTPGAQQQLAKLQEMGLVDAEERKQPRGRPRKYWFLSAQGNEHFPDRHSDLTLEILQSTLAVFGEDGLQKLVKHREQQTLKKYNDDMQDCRSLLQKIERLAALRTTEGYMAEFLPLKDGSYRLIENHCPICVAARTCESFCQSELDIFRTLLGPDVDVKREEHAIQGERRCCYLISDLDVKSALKP